eukprot:3941930-Rhodomonas_salina.15
MSGPGIAYRIPHTALARSIKDMAPAVMNLKTRIPGCSSVRRRRPGALSACEPGSSIHELS